jgi:hypothetical protein
MTSAPPHRHSQLRLIPPSPSPRPRRLDVRISASDGRVPYGRSRAFHLTESDIQLLLEAAMRMEARRA